MELDIEGAGIRISAEHKAGQGRVYQCVDTNLYHRI